MRSKVRGLVCWMYLLPNWLTPRGQPVCERLGGTTDMLASSSAGGERKGGGRETFPGASSGYLRATQQLPPAINVKEQGEAFARRKCIRSPWRQEVEGPWPARRSAIGRPLEGWPQYLELPLVDLVWVPPSLTLVFPIGWFWERGILGL